MVSKEEKMKLVDLVFKKYKKTVNMSFGELKRWSKNPNSRLASLTRAPINKNLRLLKTPRLKWGLREVKWALKTISFVKRMRKVNRGKIVVNGLSKRDIALRNWGYNFKK